MAEQKNGVGGVASAMSQLPDGVLDLTRIPPELAPGCRIFMHYNGPTEQLSGLCAGMAVLDPGASPHPVHQHPEEEFLIIADGTGEIECGGQTTQVGPGAIMYCNGNVPHGVVNTGLVPMTFYWAKWMAKRH